MSAKSADTPIISSDLKRSYAYALTQADYDEIPELTDEFFEHADVYDGEQLVRRGRPQGRTRLSTTLRLDAQVLAAFKASGKGWQTRINAALKQWVSEHGDTLSRPDETA